MNGEVEIRPMTVFDLESILDIARLLPQAPHWPRSTWEEALNPLDPAAGLSRVALVAVAPKTEIEPAGGSIVGFVVASLLPPQAELELIAVAPGAQRRGVGRQLFAALAAELREAAITEVTLEVRSSNTPALALYRRLGFAESGLRTRYYADPVEDALLLTLGLV